MEPVEGDRSTGIAQEGRWTHRAPPTALGDRIINALTVDVEDYFHVSAFADRIRSSQWDGFESRVVRNTHSILELLDRHSVRGTFFVLGWVAERFPDLIRTIRRGGHDIGCHSYGHELVYRQTPEAFRADLVRARDVLEQIVGEPVTAYRAPSFSITAQSLWALEILIAEGFRFDSSVFPTHHDRYGLPGAERFPHTIRTRTGALCELPPSIHRVLGYPIPLAGGGYFRLYPLRLTLHWMRCIHDRHRRPCIFYVHPWELDPEQPRLAASLLSRYRHYQNLRTTEPKLDRLLKTFRFATLQEVWTTQSEYAPVVGVDELQARFVSGSRDRAESQCA